VLDGELCAATPGRLGALRASCITVEARVTLLEFRDPRVIREHRRCGRCGDTILVFVMDGASLPREPHYRCSECHDVPEATADRVAALTIVQPELGSHGVD
jgi:ribosomal protein S27AE